jgi:acetyl-CoA acetyltransferase
VGVDPLLMNAFNTVNLASAVILTSTSVAQELGIPKERWIYLLGGAGIKDADEFWKRPNYYTSPSISRSLDACLSVSKIAKEDIDLYDFYSCFPIVPKMACQHLGLPMMSGEKPITLLGGLTSFGGAGNNYSMHALTEMTRQLRDGKGKKGLVLANGGVLSYQHVIVLSTTPREGGGYPERNPLPPQVTDLPVPEVMVDAEGEAEVEVWFPCSLVMIER